MDHRIPGALIIPIVLAADQITKTFAVAHLAGKIVAVTPFFNLLLAWNKGVSFGMFNDGKTSVWILVALTLLITALFAVWLWRARNRAFAAAAGLVIGGALGNVVDRVRYGAVADFLDFHAFGWHWPAFNLADSCIVLGIAYIVFDGLFLDTNKKESNQYEQKI